MTFILQFKFLCSALPLTIKKNFKYLTICLPIYPFQRIIINILNSCVISDFFLSKNKEIDKYILRKCQGSET